METQVMDNQVSTNDTEPQVTETKPAENNVDLSAYFKDGEAGVFDENKIEKLAKDYENQKKSTSYFQSMYMKKNPVPETADGYAKSFKADSMYEGVMGEESVKSAINEIRKFAFDNKIGERETNMFTDYILKNAVKSNIIDTRTPEQLKAEQQKLFDEAAKEVQPMLDSLGRTLDENNRYIENFLKSPSVFTNSPEMIETIKSVAAESASGYKLITMLANSVDHREIPVTGIVTSSVSAKDKSALMAELQKIDDPELREQKLREFYGEK